MNRLLPYVVGIGFAALVNATAGEEPHPTNRRIMLQHCLVTAKQDVEIPALRTGQMAEILCREGESVEAGRLLGRIDDVEATLQFSFATAEKLAAHQRAASNLEEQFAQAAHDVSLAERDAAVEANKAVSKSVSDIEVMRLDSAAKQSSLQVAVSRFKQEMQKVELAMVDAKAELAAADIDRRRLNAPFTGDIVDIAVDPGEWVEAGTTVFRIVAADRLQVEGYLKVQDVPPSVLHEKPVLVYLPFGSDEQVAFEGKIAFVSPVVDAGNQYRIWAEVANRRERGRWVLRPGMHVRMVVQQ